MKNPVFYCQERSMRNVLLISAILCCVGVSCAPKKHMSRNEVSGEVTVLNGGALSSFYEDLSEHQLHFQTLSARGKGFLTINNKDQYDINLQLRMEQGKSIWMSVTTFLGMEAVRVFITPDSVQVINRLESVYFQDTFDMIEDLMGGHLDFLGLQQLLLGNTPLDMSKKELTEVVRNEQTTILRVSGMVGQAEIRINPNYRLETYIMRDMIDNDSNGQNGIEVNHGYQESFTHPELPNKTSILLESSKTKLAVTLDYSRVEMGATINVPFSIPKGYKQIH